MILQFLQRSFSYTKDMREGEEREERERLMNAREAPTLHTKTDWQHSQNQRENRELDLSHYNIHLQLKSAEGSGWRSKRGGGSTAEPKAYRYLYSWNLSRRITSRQADLRYSLLYIHFRGLFQARQTPEGMAKPTKHQSSKQWTGGQMPPAKQGKERRRKSQRNRNKTNKQERKKRNNAHILRVTGSTMAGGQAFRRRLTSQAWHQSQTDSDLLHHIPPYSFRLLSCTTKHR